MRYEIHKQVLGFKKCLFKTYKDLVMRSGWVGFWSFPNKDDGGVDDDGDAASDIGNDNNCGDGRSKVDCSKDTVVDVSNSKSDGGGDTNDYGKGGDDSDGEGMSVLMDTKMMVIMMDV